MYEEKVGGKGVAEGRAGSHRHATQIARIAGETGPGGDGEGGDLVVSGDFVVLHALCGCVGVGSEEIDAMKPRQGPL